jgi:tryptophanase
MDVDRLEKLINQYGAENIGLVVIDHNEQLGRRSAGLGAKHTRNCCCLQKI